MVAFFKLFARSAQLTENAHIEKDFLEDKKEQNQGLLTNKTDKYYVISIFHSFPGIQS